MLYRSLALGIASVTFFTSVTVWSGRSAAEDKGPVEVVPQVGHAGSISSIAFSPDGHYALSGGDQTPMLWDLVTGRQLRSFRGSPGIVLSVAYSSDGRYALSGGFPKTGPGGIDAQTDTTLTLWEVATGKKLHSFPGHAGIVSAVALSPDGRFVLSNSHEKTLQLRELKTGKEVRTFGGHSVEVNSVAFSPDNELALSGGDNQLLQLWDVATGTELRTFSGHVGAVQSVAFSPSGKWALSGGNDHTLKLWDVATGKALRTFSGHTESVASVAFSPDGRFALSGGKDALKLWETDTGKELRSFGGSTSFSRAIAFSQNGEMALASDDRGMRLWEVATGRELRTFFGYFHATQYGVAFSPEGRLAISGSSDHTLKLWDVASGKELQAFSGHTEGVASAAFSPSGELAVSGSSDHTVKLWEVATGKELRTFNGHTEGVESVVFSPNGELAASGSWDHTVKLWEVATGKELRTFSGHTEGVKSVAFSPDGRFAFSGSGDNTLKLWEVATGQEVRSISGGDIESVAFSADGNLAAIGGLGSNLSLWAMATGKRLWHFDAASVPMSVAFSPDGRFILSGDFDGTLTLWEADTGKVLRTFRGHDWAVVFATFLPDDRFAVSASMDGTTRIWDVKNGSELAMMVSGPNGEWLTMTPQGFFSASHRDTDMLAIVRGAEATTIGQIHQSLFNPDLVREALAGDPVGEVERAAKVANLEKVLDAGPPPVASIVSDLLGKQSNVDLVSITARITDRGKGIGRVEWRVNGITVGVMTAPANAGADYNIGQTLALDPGQNNIEVIAYERRNLLASLPARMTITYNGPVDNAKPKLHILAIGINRYVDKGGKSGGYFPPLGLAVRDAEGFAAEMQKARGGLYSEIRVTKALDLDATAAGLDRIFEKISAEISPRDTFVLYAAAHGYSKDGRFYLIPQDYQGGTSQDSLNAHAIGQEHLQYWIANRIKAKKALILLDTCESGALVSGYAKSRTDAPASEAAIGRLHEATGRPVLTAAASGKPAFEGYKEHGVFTFALIDALHHGDSNRNDVIELSELVAHVQTLVPKLSTELNGRGVATVAVRGFGDDKQSAHFGSTGEDFAFVDRLP